MCPRTLCWPGPCRPPGAGPWLCHMRRATVLPLAPMLPWASHCGPATLSCHIIGDNQWAWVSMAHQGQRQPAQEPMCSLWIATWSRYCPPPPIPLNQQGHPALSYEVHSCLWRMAAASAVTLPPAGGGAEAKDDACGGDSQASFLWSRTPLGAIHTPSFPKPSGRG